jgi:hypothetical protein
MDVDWIISIVVFLFFVSLSFSFYSAIINQNKTDFENIAFSEIEKINSFLSIDVYELPVIYESNEAVTNAVLKAQGIWYYGEKNATIVLAGDQNLPCKIDDDALYWQADIEPNKNYFIVKIANLNTSLLCNASFSTSNYNLTIPLVFEKQSMLSLTKINEMINMDYENFKKIVGVNKNFKIIIDDMYEYGRSPPKGAINVYSKNYRKKIFENSQWANVTIVLW